MNENLVTDKIKKFLSGLLETNDIDLNHNFYDMGGNSLLGIQFMSFIHENFNMELTIKELFENNIIDLIDNIEKNIR